MHGSLGTQEELAKVKRKMGRKKRGELCGLGLLLHDNIYGRTRWDLTSLAAQIEAVRGTLAQPCHCPDYPWIGGLLTEQQSET